MPVPDRSEYMVDQPERISQDEILYSFDTLGELVYIADIETYDMLYANDAVRRLIGGPYEGRKCYEAITGVDAPCEFCTNNLLKRDSYYAWTRYNENLGGYYALKDRLIRWNGRPARLEIAFDMTEHRSQLLGLETELGLERLLVRCVREMRDIDGFSGDLSSVLQMIGEAMGADRAYIFQVFRTSGGHEAFTNSHEWCASGVAPQINELQNVDLGVVGQWVSPFLHRETVVIEDLEEIRETSPSEYALLKPQGIKSLVNAPLLAKSELIGSIGVDNPTAVRIGRTREFFDDLAYFLSTELESYLAKERLKVMSFTDSLTGLKNRNRFIADMETLDAQGPRKGFGVAYLDLNGLKEVNDSEGHAQGDSMLSMVADVLRSAFDGSSVYRLGGDEFLAINSSTSESAFMRQARDACERLDERSCPVAAGLFYAAEPCLVDYAVSCADRRMYKQKQNYYEKHPALDPRRAARNGFKIK